MPQSKDGKMNLEKIEGLWTIFLYLFFVVAMFFFGRIAAEAMDKEFQMQDEIVEHWRR